VITRTHSKSVVFSRPFLLKGIDRLLPPGDYRVVTDEELIEGISFPVYRRVSTMMFVPSQSRHGSSVEMVTIDPADLQTAQDSDAAAQRVSTAKSGS
jgi:hypothetical protein